MSPGTLSRVSATENIHERKKKIYALRTTWRNSGPRIRELGDSRHGTNENSEGRPTNAREDLRNAKSDNETCERAFVVEISKQKKKWKEARLLRGA